MNYYERHLGDYAKDTLHLSMLEHGAYTLLMDRYYSTERGIPSEQVYRVALARSKDEKAAVDSVLSEFFTLNDGLWIKGRIEEEIERYLSGEPEREAKKANEKNRLSKHREERAALFKQLTDAGQHAVWNISITELRERVKNVTETGKYPSPETQPATATETPATATQEPDTIPNIKPTSPPGAGAKFAMRTDWNPSTHLPDLAKQAGCEIKPEKLGEFITHWLTQPLTQRTQAEWDKALLQSAKHDKLHAESNPPAKTARKPENFSQRDYGKGVTAL